MRTASRQASSPVSEDLNIDLGPLGTLLPER
jgi:hypothetical protein